MKTPAAIGKVTARQRSGGFTLVEIMLVIAIIGVVMTMGLPTMFRTMRKTPMRQAVSDLEEGCRAARMMAIMQGRPAELIINAQDGQLNVGLVTEINVGKDGADPVARTDEEKIEAASAPPPPPPGGSFSAHLPDSVAFKRLFVNLRDQMEFEQARIHFYPNGTSDALSATLLSEQNEERTLELEITTGRDNVVIIR